MVDIWPSPPSAVKSIFLTNRYLNLVSQLGVVLNSLGIANPSNTLLVCLLLTFSFGSCILWLNMKYLKLCHIYVLGYGLLVFGSLVTIHRKLIT